MNFYRPRIINGAPGNIPQIQGGLLSGYVELKSIATPALPIDAAVPAIAVNATSP